MEKQDFIQELKDLIEEFEGDEYNIVLKDVGDCKIKVIKAIRKITGFDLCRAKRMVESAPVLVDVVYDAIKADGLKDLLEDAGAKVHIN